METHSRDDMDLKEETTQVWSESAEQEQNTAQVTGGYEILYKCWQSLRMHESSLLEFIVILKGCV